MHQILSKVAPHHLSGCYSDYFSYICNTIKKNLKSMKRTLLAVIGLLLAIEGYSAVTTPAVCPEPQRYEISRTEYLPFESLSIVCSDIAAQDWAKSHLKQWYGKFAPQVSGAKGKTAMMGEEEYRIKIDKGGVKVTAKSLQGVRYALYTLRQLAIPSRGTEKVEGWIVPKSEIEDKPEMGFRGMHLCWFRETKAWEIERQIRLAAYYKFNYVVIESWGAYRSKVAPWWGWRDGEMTIKEIKRLKAIADDLGVTLIPQLNIFGHATLARHGTGKHAALDLKPEYQPYFEPLAGWNWCLSNPKTKILHKALIKEMYEVFGCPPYFHIGCDEASAPSCPECVKSSYSTLFADYVKEISSYVKSLGAKSLMWHDMLLDKGEGKWEYAKGTKETASLLRELPRDIIICDWYYRKPLESYPSLDHFKALGFEVLTCPWDNNKGTLSLLSYAHKLGLKGVLGTLWHHNHGRWLLDIYFLVANRAWNSDSSLAVYGSIYNNHYAIHTHLRHIGWDMKNKNPRHAGVFYDELPPEPYQTW